MRATRSASRRSRSAATKSPESCSTSARSFKSMATSALSADRLRSSPPLRRWGDGRSRDVLDLTVYRQSDILGVRKWTIFDIRRLAIGDDGGPSTILRRGYGWQAGGGRAEARPSEADTMATGPGALQYGGRQARRPVHAKRARLQTGDGISPGTRSVGSLRRCPE